MTQKKNTEKTTIENGINYMQFIIYVIKIFWVEIKDTLAEGKL